MISCSLEENDMPITKQNELEWLLLREKELQEEGYSSIEAFFMARDEWLDPEVDFTYN